MPALADAALDAQERALLDGFVSALRAEYGDDLDEGLAQAAHRAQARREASDHAAEPFEISAARTLVATAERFVAEVERLAG